MRENAASMDKLVQEKHGKMASMNAVDDLKTYQDFSQAHLDGLKNLTSAFKSLYDSMPADQKKNADQRVRQLRPAEVARSRARRSIMTKRITLAVAGDRRLCRPRHARQRPLVRRRSLARGRPLARQQQQLQLRLPLSRSAGGLRHAVQLRLLRAAGRLRRGARHQLERPHSMSRASVDGMTETAGPGPPFLSPATITIRP